ncbi:hypothetical protein [uncultured Tenacibaculum sp.]|uniref:hypothetical protein n=1 Tax=uncultured Tenacibaculum sp. TaxID=174713 RepID=UPI00261D2BCB|nr:hypothetical protein [uncultured Tenacibaculum sp.]
MKNRWLIILICAFTSCHFNNEKVKFKIINNTSFIIDSLNIKPNTFESLKYVKLVPKQKIEYCIDMSEALPIDDSYRLEYKIKDTVVVRKFGYYAKGTPIDDYIIINIEKDTIKYVSREI